MSRMPWQQYFMNITRLVAERATCSRRKVGAIAVKDNRIIATGYNGAPKGLADCFEVGCLRDELNISPGERHELCRGIHAEQNIFVQAAQQGIVLEGAEIYCTHQPCFICAKLIINCGIIAVYYEKNYPDPLAEAIFAETDIIFQQIPMLPPINSQS